MSDALRDLLTRHVEAGTMPGAVATIGAEFAPVAVGLTGPGGVPIPLDAVFRIQSMTKAVTSVAALRLVQDGVIALEDPVSHWLPELADRRVLAHPDGPLGETRPARGPITVRHLLTNQSGYGMMTTDSPLKQAMIDARVEADAGPVGLGAQDWLDALATLPLAFEPGEAWRYHHSFGLLGILLGRVSDRSALELLNKTVFSPAGMTDTGFSVPLDQAHRLLPSFRHGADGLEQTEPAASGFYVEPLPFDVSHAELVSTVTDYHSFLRALLDGRLIDAAMLDEMRRDQVPSRAKSQDSFFNGFWEKTGWGYGVSVATAGPHRGRFGWSGGLGTDFFVDPDGTIYIVLTQVEMGEQVIGLLRELQELGGS